MTTDSETEPRTTESGARGVLAYWGPPVLLGLLIGLGIVAIARLGGIGESEVDQIVERWEWGDAEANTELGADLAELGSTARPDLRAAFLDVPESYMDMKVWVADRLLDEPFFDSKWLAGVAQESGGPDARAAAVALAQRLREEADLDVVMPGILDWMNDLSRDDQSAPISALAALGPLTSEWRDRARPALIGLARKRPAVSADPDADFIPEVRADAISVGLASFLPDDEVELILHETIVDDDDDYAPRVAAVRALSENGRISDLDAWMAASRSQDEIVRQAVAENLFRAPDASYAKVLEPMHVDAHPYVRSGSIETQVQRGQPTMLPVMDQLLQDHDPWVRFYAMNACAAFRDQPGAPARNGQLLRILAESDERTDVEAALLALHTITKKAFGVREADLHHYVHEVEETALDAFMKDPEARANAVDRYREAFGGTAVWTDSDRRATLTKMLEHADPDNRKRAERLLAQMGE